MLLDHEALCELIPHTGAMCLLDEVLSCDENTIVCQSRSHRNADNPLRKNGRLSAIHAVEYAAQAMAAHGGLLAREQGARLKPGYLAALKDVQLHTARLDDIAGPLTVRAERLMAAGGNLMYTLEVFAGERLLASARATVVTQAEPL